MTTLQDTIQRYLNGVATPAEAQELRDLAEAQGLSFKEFIVQDQEETFAAAFENIDTTQNEFSPQDFFDQRLAVALCEKSQKQKKTNIIPINGDGFGMRGWLLAAATVAVLLLVGVYWFNAERMNPLNKIAQHHAAVSTFTGPDNVQLPDGSTLTLNANSELRVHQDFGNHKREVFLTGEAFFDVAHDPSKPFIVHSGSITTTVLGTAFNVRAFPGEEIKVTVERGLVEVASEERIYGQLEQDHQMTVKSETDDFVAKKIDASKETIWKDELLVFKDVTMQEAAKRIGEKFDLTVVITNDDLRPCKVNTFFFKGDGIEKVLSVLASLTKATYRVEGTKAFIEGGRCE